MEIRCIILTGDETFLEDNVEKNRRDLHLH